MHVDTQHSTLVIAKSAECVVENSFQHDHARLILANAKTQSRVSLSYRDWVSDIYYQKGSIGQNPFLNIYVYRERHVFIPYKYSQPM